MQKNIKTLIGFTNHHWMTTLLDASFKLDPIAITESCFVEKFGIPRQPRLVPSALARLRVLNEFADPEAFDGIEQCSHLWLIFGFSAVPSENIKLRVRPPRLGGNKRLGVFATRSTHRPNRIGMSAVKFVGLENKEGALYIYIEGADLLDGTPIFDIKPYVPYTDSVDDAHYGVAPGEPETLSVQFAPELESWMLNYRHPLTRNLRQLIVEVLNQDPAPAYHQRSPGREYGMALLNLNIRWEYRIEAKLILIHVLAIDRLTED